MIASLLFTLLAQAPTVTVAPAKVAIPSGQEPLGLWPDFENDPGVGHRTFVVKYTVGAAPIAAGGGLMLGLGYPTPDTSNPAYAVNSGWLLGPNAAMARFPVGRFQVTTQGSANFCTASASNGAALTLRTIYRGNYGHEVLLKATTTPLLATGTTITFTLGAGLGMTVSWNPGRPEVYLAEDLAGTGQYALSSAALPSILFTGAMCERYIVNGPVTARVGVPFRVTVRAVQGADNPGAASIFSVEDYQSPVSVLCSDHSVIYPQPIPAFEHGVLEFRAMLSAPGLQTFHVFAGPPGTATLEGVQGLSNPIMVLPAADDLEILCGDLQRHSAEGGHAAVTDDLCWSDLYDDGQDFGTVVQHSQNYMAGFQHANLQAARFQASVSSDDFTCFPGYEWTLPGSHRHVVYRNLTSDPAITDAAYLGFESPAPVLEATTDGFLNYLKTGLTDEQHFAVPHHTLWNFNQHGLPPIDAPYEWGADPDTVDQPVVEIYSAHGSSEVWLAQAGSPDDYPLLHDLAAQRAPSNLASVRDALKLGYRFGIIAGSDQHGYSGNLVEQGVEYERTGLAFARASRAYGNRRARIWDAIRRRCTYGTTGARIVLDWITSAGTDMGGEEVSSSPSFALEAHAAGIGVSERPIFTKADVIRDDQVVASTTFSGSDVTWSWTDPAPITGGAFHAYYVRIVQSDWHVAWSSPIWVSVP